jgi:starch-binding outer membrane protein, SusD/RagB family
MKKIMQNIGTLGSLIWLLTSCGFLKTDFVVEPNAPPLESVLNNPGRNTINQLGIGIQSAMRDGAEDFYRNSGTVGREIIYSASTDNRYFNELLGTEATNFEGANDPNGIFNAYYFNYANTRRRAEIFTRSASTSTVLSDAEKSGVKGFARTVQAYVVLNQLNMQGKNGIRESFSDLNAPGDLLKPGKFGTYESGLVLAKSLLDEGASELDKAGTAFAFPLTGGWEGFDTPAQMKKFNRALAARVAMYQKDWAGMATALQASFLDIADTLATGPVFTYATTAGDQINDLYQTTTEDENGAPFVAFDDFVTDAEAGDLRVARKLRKRKETRNSGQNIKSDYQVQIYAFNTSSISILRNEELILMSAEAKIQTGDLAGAVAALDRIRKGAGLKNLATAKPAILSNKDALIDEVLNQRRYSLFFEGHRWFDARRYNKLGILPFQGKVGNSEYKVFENFNRPDAEVQWDVRNP